MRIISIPETCPSCNAKLTQVSGQIFCSNTADCPAQNSKALEHYCKITKIKGFGTQTIKKLSLTDISGLYDLTEEGIAEVLGEKMGAKLYKEVLSKTSLDLSTFIAALSIPLVGLSTAKKLEQGCFDTFESLTYPEMRAVGITDKAARNLENYIVSNLAMLKTLPLTITNTTNKPVVDTKTSGLVFTVTGKVAGYTKATIDTTIRALGGQTTPKVTLKTTHLICEEDKMSSSKEKAIKNGIPIISMSEAINILSN